MPELPRKLAAGQVITSKDWNAIIDCLNAIWPRPSGDIAPNMASGGGTSYSLIARRKAKSAAPVTATADQSPFQIYQHNADPANTTSDWRTVWVHQGLFNNQLPDNSDAADEPKTIVVDADTTDVWIALAVQRGVDGHVEKITLVSKADADQVWANYPVVENYSNVMFYLLGTVDTGVDSPADDGGDPPTPTPHYHELTINQIVTDNLLDFLHFQPWPDFTLYQFVDLAAPPTAWLNIKIVPGKVGTVAPDNMDDTFTITAGATTVFWLEITLGSDWQVSSVTINHGDTAPDQPTLTACDTPPDDPFIVLLGSVVASAAPADPPTTGQGKLTFQQRTPGEINIAGEKLLAKIKWDDPDLKNVYTRIVYLNGTPIVQTDSDDPDATCEEIIDTTEECDS